MVKSEKPLQSWDDGEQPLASFSIVNCDRRHLVVVTIIIIIIIIIFYYHLIVCFNSDVVGEPSAPSEIEKGHSLAGLLKCNFKQNTKIISSSQPIEVTCSEFSGCKTQSKISQDNLKTLISKVFPLFWKVDARFRVNMFAKYLGTRAPGYLDTWISGYTWEPGWL